MTTNGLPITASPKISEEALKGAELICISNSRMYKMSLEQMTKSISLDFDFIEKSNEIQNLCKETKDVAAEFINNTIQCVGVIDMAERASGRAKGLPLSVVGDNGEWLPNTELFPEYGIYKLINAAGKSVTGGGTAIRTKSRITLTNDTVYINYQNQTVDIYDNRHYTIYHTYDNTDANEQWDNFYNITNLEINEKIANAIPFVNKPDNSSYIQCYDFDFDAGAINRIVFPCTLCDYEEKPLIELKINDLVTVSYDENENGYVQVITKEGIYLFKMANSLPTEDCILPTMGEVKKLIQSLTDRIETLETALAAKEGGNEQ